MKRFFLLFLSVLFLIICVLGVILAAAGFDDGNNGMATAGCIVSVIMLLFFVLCVRKAKQIKAAKATVIEDGVSCENNELKTNGSFSDKFGIDYVVNVGRKRSVYIMMVHYKSGRVKRVRTRFDSLEFRHYAKYIKQ